MPTAAITKLDTVEKKLYQMIISRLEGESIPLISYQEKIFELVRKGIGGFIIFGGKKDEVRNFIDTIQSISIIPLFIASDIERGVGQQVQDSTIFPCQMAMAAAIDRNKPKDISILRNAIKAIVNEANDVGINMPLIPVLDVNRDPDNPIICTRAFSDSPEEVAWFGSEYIKILESSGLISCAKHFPGHGDTSTDSHIALPVIRKSYEDLMNIDLMPFKEAIQTGVSSIMVGHLSIPAIDIKPASLSKKIITHLLRKELGYNGLITTDALIMSALKDIKNVYSQCIKAGADILLHPVDPDSAVRELKSAVEFGEIMEEQIEAALNRIMMAKKKLKPAGEQEIDYQKNEIRSSQITDMSISLFKNTPGLLPVWNKNMVHVIFAGDDGLFESSLFRNYFKNCLMISSIKRNTIINPPVSLPDGRQAGPFRKGGLTTPLIPLNKGGMGVVKGGKVGLLDATTLFAIFTSVAAWKGSSGIEGSEKNRIQEVIKKAKKSIVVSFGNPYVLRHFKEADILIAAYESSEQAQKAVIKCLEGRMDFRGKLPVKLDS